MYIHTPQSPETSLGLPASVPKSQQEWGKTILPAPQPTLVERIRAWLASLILQNPKITLATIHSETPLDNATAHRNVEDTANYDPAARSRYKSAPGGTINLDIRMLLAILKLASLYNFQISELTGGVHSWGSLHYSGRAIDINVINGRDVNRKHPDVTSFKQDCRKLGATEILGPGDPNHDTHIHCGWPRP